MRCKHFWEERHRYFCPQRSAVELGAGTAELIRELAYGVTVVELRCAKCHDISERRLVGDATHPQR